VTSLRSSTFRIRPCGTAMKILRERGLIVSILGRGTFIASALEERESGAGQRHAVNARSTMAV